MPVTPSQLLAGAAYQLESYATGDPIDQYTTDKPFSKWLVDNKIDSVFGNGIFNEKIRITNDANYQNYSGDDLVTYNRRNPDRKAPFQHYEAHDGFMLNETELANNGILMTDDREAVMTGAETIQITSLIKENRNALKMGFQDNWDLEVHRNGSLSAKAVPGLDFLVSTDGLGVVGGIDATAFPFWRNNFQIGVAATPGALVAAMEVMFRRCQTYGGSAPNFILCGSKFLDAYAADVRAQPGSTIFLNRPSKGGVDLDGSRSGVWFKGIELVWDPTFDTLQTADAPAIPWDKRCYFLNSKFLHLRPVKGRWMVNRTPSRMYDRYTHYFAVTSDYGLTISKRNAMGVISIA